MGIVPVEMVRLKIWVLHSVSINSTDSLRNLSTPVDSLVSITRRTSVTSPRLEEDMMKSWYWISWGTVVHHSPIFVALNASLDTAVSHSERIWFKIWQYFALRLCFGFFKSAEGGQVSQWNRPTLFQTEGQRFHHAFTIVDFHFGEHKITWCQGDQSFF